MTILSLLNTKNVKNWSGSPIKDFGDDYFPVTLRSIFPATKGLSILIAMNDYTNY